LLQKKMVIIAELQSVLSAWPVPEAATQRLIEERGGRGGQ
jgi:hypothetical protein